MKATTEELIVFVSVVENRSFSRAARQLGQANSVVSRMIKRLEAKLGVSLLNRTTRQISLTQEGEGYFSRVQKILQSMEAAELALLDSLQKPKGLLRIDGASPVILHIITPHIAEFRQHYPDVQISLLTSETFINLIERKVDIAIRFGELENSSLRARKLMDTRRYLVAAPAYLDIYGLPKALSDLDNHSLIGFWDLPDLNRWPFMQEDGELYQITSAITANSGETLRHLCLQGNGIACLSDYLIHQDLKDGSLVKIDLPQARVIKQPIHAVYYSDQAVSNRIRCFIDFMSERLPMSYHV